MSGSSSGEMKINDRAGRHALTNSQSRVTIIGPGGSDGYVEYSIKISTNKIKLNVACQMVGYSTASSSGGTGFLVTKSDLNGTGNPLDGECFLIEAEVVDIKTSLVCR